MRATDTTIVQADLTMAAFRALGDKAREEGVAFLDTPVYRHTAYVTGGKRKTVMVTSIPVETSETIQ